MNNLKVLRRKANLTQMELSILLGISQSTVGMWENGKNKPRADMLPKIAKQLDCTVDELLKE